jgi:DNA-binding NarL/FixJ family response regulator
MSITLALIEDDAPIREGLCEYLNGQPEFACVLVAESVEEFLARLPTAPALPTLILCDIGLPGRTGIEGLPLIKAQLPTADVLMLSVFTDAKRVFNALCAGAVGYLLKNTPLPELKQHLLQVAAGGSPMSPSVARHVIASFHPAPAPASGEKLTPREREIVKGIEDGLNYKLIAERLFISPETVRNHIRHVYRKLEVNSKGELLALKLKQQRPF